MLEGIRWLWSLLFIGCLVGVSGCLSKDSTGEKTGAKPYHGQELDLVAPASLEIPALWEVMIQEWSAQSGATARFKTYDQEASEFEKQALVDADRPSVVLCPLNRVCEVERQFSPLNTSDGQFDSRDIFKGLRERVLSRDRKVVLSPISVPVLVCYYRSDLLQAAKLAVPETWDDYRQLAETLESWAPGLVAVEPLGPQFRATTFFARALAFAKHPENYSIWFDVDSGQPTLNTPGFELALTTAQQTWKKLAPESIGYSPSECRNLVLSGKAALALAFETVEGELVAATSAPVKSSPRMDGIKIGICRLPGARTVYNRNSKKWDALPAKAIHAPNLCGFAGLVAGVTVSKKSQAADAAMNLLATLSSPSAFGRAFAVLPKNACRESQVAEAASWYAPDLSAEESSQYCDAVAESLRDTQLVFELPVIGASEFRHATSKALEPLLRGDSEVAQTIQSLQQEFESIVGRLGSEAVRDSYRRGLGISPYAKKP